MVLKKILYYTTVLTLTFGNSAFVFAQDNTENTGGDQTQGVTIPPPTQNGDVAPGMPPRPFNTQNLTEEQKKQLLLMKQ